MGHKGFTVLTVLFLVLAWFSWKNENLQDERLANYVSTAPATASRSTTATTADTTIKQKTSVSQYANIEATLRVVADKWKKTDVNKDGLHNCIDAAVLFYTYFPDKDKVCIEINVNPKTGMNHLFNCVFTDGVWKAVEPQAYAINQKNYYMWAVWGSQYDKNYNRDVTETWKVYVK